MVQAATVGLLRTKHTQEASRSGWWEIGWDECRLWIVPACSGRSTAHGTDPESSKECMGGVGTELAPHSPQAESIRKAKNAMWAD